MHMQDSETSTQLVPSQPVPCNIMGVETGADTVVSLRTAGAPPCAVVPWGWLANGGRPPQRVPRRRRPVHGPCKAAQGTSPTTQLALSLMCPLCSGPTARCGQGYQDAAAGGAQPGPGQAAHVSSSYFNTASIAHCRAAGLPSRRCMAAGTPVRKTALQLRRPTSCF